MTHVPKHSRSSLARRLRLQQLVIFEKVLEAGSILAASRELAMTQPAVSKSIHDIERQLGESLFVRGKQGVVPTAFGQAFEHHAKAMLAELRYLAEALNAAHSGATGHVVVGTLITASASLLPQAITRLRTSAPDVVVTVRVGANSMLFPALARGEVDVVVGYLPDAAGAELDQAGRARLAHVRLYDEALCVAVGPQHPLARRRRVAAEALRSCDWIIPTPDSVAYPQVRAFFAQQGLALPHAPVESISILTNLELLRSSEMVALMPQSAATRFAAAGLLSILPLAGLSPFSAVGYTLRADRQPTSATARFVTALEEAGRSLRGRN